MKIQFHRIDTNVVVGLLVREFYCSGTDVSAKVLVMYAGTRTPSMEPQWLAAGLSQLIAERNQMTVQHLAVGGQTMAMPPIPGTFSNSFSNGMYKTIDEDVDYITLYYGINISCVHYNAFVTGPSILLNFF